MLNQEKSMKLESDGEVVKSSDDLLGLFVDNKVSVWRWRAEKA